MKNTEDVTLQQLFDRMATHMLKQNKKALGRHEACLYRAPDGCQCAVGCLIADEHYSPDLEGASAGSPLAAGKRLREALAKSLDIPALSQQQIKLLARCQTIHDSREIDMWREELQSVAVNFGLDTAVLS